MINHLREDEVEEGKALVGRLFKPLDLATGVRNVQVHLDDLIAPAWRMSNNTRLSFEEALQHYKDSPEEQSSDYLSFKNQYDCESSIVQLQVDQDVWKNYKWKRTPEPRISELIEATKSEAMRMKSPNPAHLNGEADDGVQRSDFADCLPKALEMYLPVLFEDPTRMSAWKIGRSTRQMAGFLLLHLYELESRLFEHAKSGTTIVKTELGKLSSEDLKVWLTGFAEFLQSSLQRGDDVEGTNLWRLLVMQLVLIDINEEQKKSPDVEAVIQIMKGVALTDWQLIHLSAQYQAAYYSFLILKQILDLLAASAKKCTDIEIHSHLLQQLLGDLPCVAQFFEVESERKDEMADETWDMLLESVE